MALPRCNCWRRCGRLPVRRRSAICSAISKQVARETSLPLTLYLNPGPGAEVSIPDTIALAKLPRVQFIKESSRDLARVSRLIVEIDRAGHAQYFTTMQMLLASLELGGSGATMPPPAAEIARHVIEAFVAKDYERAAQLQLQFALFPGKWMHYGLGAGHEGGDESDRRAGRRSVSAVCAAVAATTWRRWQPISKARVLAPRVAAPAAA